MEGDKLDLSSRLYQYGTLRKLNQMRLIIELPENLGKELHMHKEQKHCDDFLSILASLFPSHYNKEKIFEELKNIGVREESII